MIILFVCLSLPLVLAGFFSRIILSLLGISEKSATLINYVYGFVKMGSNETDSVTGQSGFNKDS